MINVTAINQTAMVTHTPNELDAKSQDIEHLKKLLFDGTIGSAAALIEYIKNNNPGQTVIQHQKMISEIFNSLNNQADTQSIELLESVVKPAYLQQIAYSWVFNDFYLSAFGLSNNQIEMEENGFS